MKSRYEEEIEEILANTGDIPDDNSYLKPTNNSRAIFQGIICALLIAVLISIISSSWIIALLLIISGGIIIALNVRPTSNNEKIWRGKSIESQKPSLFEDIKTYLKNR